MKTNKALATLNILFTFVLIVLGSIVSSSYLGLECTSWPLCYATKTQQAMIPELHRIFAGLILVFNLVLFIREPDSKAYRYGLFVLVGQVLLGAINFFYKLPTLMSIVHLALSVAYVILFIEVFTPKPSPQSLVGKLAKGKLPNVKDPLFLLLCLTIFQIFFGAIVHQTGTRDVCGLGKQTALMCFSNGEYSFWPMTIAGKIHMIHRYIGTFFLVVFFWALWRFQKLFKFLDDTNWKQGLSLLLLLMGAVTIHFFNIGRLFIPEAVVYYKVVHLVFAILILSLLMTMYRWAIDFELENFDRTIHTTFQDLLSLTKPRLGLLVVATIVSGILLTGQYVDFFYLLLALFASILIVASATTLNCYIEIDVDKAMVRTADRALPSGRLDPKLAIVQGVLLYVIGTAITVIYVNTVTAVLGAIAFFSYLFAYTPMKRKTPFALFVGAIPGAIPPVMGRTIVTGEIDALAIVLFAFLFIWQIPHFMAISIYYKSDYFSGDIKVYPHFWSEAKMKWAILLWTILLVASSVAGSFYDLHSQNYFTMSLAFGLGFVLIALKGFFVHEEGEYFTWARQYFFGSIIYLPIILGLMIFLS